MPSGKQLLQAFITTVVIMAIVNRVPQLKAIVSG